MHHAETQTELSVLLLIEESNTLFCKLVSKQKEIKVMECWTFCLLIKSLLMRRFKCKILKKQINSQVQHTLEKLNSTHSCLLFRTLLGRFKEADKEANWVNTVLPSGWPELFLWFWLPIDYPWESQFSHCKVRLVIPLGELHGSDRYLVLMNGTKWYI